MKRMLFIGFVFISFGLLGQISVSNSNPYNSPEYLVSDILLNTDAGTIVENVVLTNGLLNQIGYFNGANSNLGMDEGVILSTGGIGLAVPDGEDDQSGLNYQDPDLVIAMEQIGMGSNSLSNTIVLEFDFVAGDDLVEFEYVFGSKEYPGYTCSQFNDIFGFFLSGPGIQGPYSNNGINIALVPDPTSPGAFTTTPVTINTINSGFATGGYDEDGCGDIDPLWASYSIFFVNNTDESTVGFPGFTTVLKAQAELECSKNYHIKLAIADVSDGVLNSAVFLKKGSFAAGAPLGVELNDNEDFVICIDSIVIDPNLFGGFGGVDYYWSHNGQQINELVITVSEPGEYIFFASDECGSLSRTINVISYSPAVLDIPSYVFLCNDSLIIAEVSGGAPPYISYWVHNGAIVDQGLELRLNFGDNGDYTFHVEDACGFIYELEMEVESAELLDVQIPGYTYLCEDLINLQAVVSGGYGELYYYWEFQGVIYENLSLMINFDNPGLATFYVEDECGQQYIGKALVETPGDYEDMELDFKYEYLELCSNDVFFPQVHVSGGAGYKTYYWYLDGALLSNAVKYSLKGTELKEGITSKLQLLIIDQCGNEISHTYLLKGVSCIVPNVFTPNRDGINDVYLLNLGTYNKGVQLDIFNRWGQYVFRSKNYELCQMAPERACWDGENMSSGKQCIPGIYFYEIRFEDGRHLKGVINLFK